MQVRVVPVVLVQVVHRQVVQLLAEQSQLAVQRKLTPVA
jgi:hypothetical protein